MKHDLEQWEQLGNDCKEIQELLLEILNDTSRNCGIDKKTIMYLVKAHKCVSEFKSKAEDKMLQEGHFSDRYKSDGLVPTCDMSFTKVFYGTHEQT